MHSWISNIFFSYICAIELCIKECWKNDSNLKFERCSDISSIFLVSFLFGMSTCQHVHSSLTNPCTLFSSINNLFFFCIVSISIALWPNNFGLFNSKVTTIYFLFVQSEFFRLVFVFVWHLFVIFHYLSVCGISQVPHVTIWACACVCAFHSFEFINWDRTILFLNNVNSSEISVKSLLLVRVVEFRKVNSNWLIYWRDTFTVFHMCAFMIGNIFDVVGFLLLEKIDFSKVTLI